MSTSRSKKVWMRRACDNHKRPLSILQTLADLEKDAGEGEKIINHKNLKNNFPISCMEWITKRLSSE